MINEIKNRNGNFRFNINYLKLYILLGLSISFYLVYLFSSDFIHKTQFSKIDLTSISPWAVHSVLICDGVELFVMTFVMPFFLLCTFLISKSSKLENISLQKDWLFYSYLLFPISLYVINVLAKESLTIISLIVFLVGFIISYFIFHIAKQQFSKLEYIIGNVLFGVFLIVYGFFINSTASFYDYCLLIGPANKVLEGETIGKFFMLYNVITTALIACFLKFHLLIYQMHLIMIIIFAFWMFFYKKLAQTLFENKGVVYSFMITLLIIRGLAVSGGPISIPQVSPLRMDLWVPLLIIVSLVGFESIFTAIIFSVFYLFDDVFGFFYQSLYLFSLVIIFYFKFRKSNEIQLLSKLKYFIPALISLAIHFIIFNSIMSPSGKLFSKYHFDFLPISFFSSFWLLVYMLPVCFYLLLKSSKNQPIVLFSFGLVCIQLTYFFGRSADNNLNNISGIFIFILFYTIDILYTLSKNKKNAIVLICLLIGLIFLNYNSLIRDLRYTIKDKIEQGPFRKYNYEKKIERDIRFIKSLKTDKIIFLSEYDSYLYYRLGFKSTGFYTPFQINIKNDETVSFLYKKLNEEYRLITYSGPYISLPKCMNLYNKELCKIDSSKKFILCYLRNDIMELKMIPR